MNAWMAKKNFAIRLNLTQLLTLQVLTIDLSTSRLGSKGPQ